MFDEIVDFNNLIEAHKKASRLKRYRRYVLLFNQNFFENLTQIRRELIDGTYKTGDYKVFTIHEPKTRKICALPFRDRIVQHAINNIVEPVIDRRLVFDTYACRHGKGTLAAARRCRFFMQSSKAKWYLKCDVSHYFASVNKSILREIFARQGFDDLTMQLLDEIVIKDGEGLPIGNLLSQLAANLYLNELDRFCKHKLHIRHYLRYMDDFIVFGENADFYRRAKCEIEGFLREKLHLRLNERTQIKRCEDGISFVGFRIFKDRRLVKKAKVLSALRKIRATRNAELKRRRIASLAGRVQNTASEAWALRNVVRIML